MGNVGDSGAGKPVSGGGGGTGRLAVREARLKAALRENLRRRKDQSRARAGSAADGGPGEMRDDEDNGGGDG